jgi:hypothetical protein
MPEVFVDKVKRLYWPQYSWQKFFGFNTMLLTLNIIAIIIYEGLGGSWIVFPLSLATERVLNGFYHLFETIVSKQYSSGLLASVITWILEYWLIRYSLLTGEINILHFIFSILIGFVIFLLMIVPMMSGKLRNIR